MTALARALVVVVLLVVPAVAREPQRPPEEARARVEHHLREMEPIIEHFQTVLQSECPHFASPAEWTKYFDGEVDRVVLLRAHLEQAWIEATRTGDDDVRRTAKAPRKRVNDALALLDKLKVCASDNGMSFSQMTVWRRIEREVPQRQIEIALPQ